MPWGRPYLLTTFVSFGSLAVSFCSLALGQSAPTPTLAVAAHLSPSAPSSTSLQFLCGTQAPYGEWSQVAQFIAGLSTNGYSLTAEQEWAWSRHAEYTNASWARVEARYLSRIDNWRKRMVDRRYTTDVAFYPFSGPDAANLFTFFPDAREYVMIGLQPAG